MAISANLGGSTLSGCWVRHPPYSKKLSVRATTTSHVDIMMFISHVHPATAMNGEVSFLVF